MTGAAGRGARKGANHPRKQEDLLMLSNYPVACPHETCD
jgi:hypothetical protein